jgi:hypothetical protein
MLVFTKFANDPKSIRERKNGRRITEDRAIMEYTQHFIEAFKFKPERGQFCFIDNGVDRDPDATEYEK